MFVVGPGLVSKRKRSVFSAAGAAAFTVPVDCVTLLVTIVGSGGGGSGGGGGAATGATPGGGSGGAAGSSGPALRRRMRVTPGEVLALVVGAGGVGGGGGAGGNNAVGNDGNDGNDGGNTTVTGALETLVVLGGKGSYILPGNATPRGKGGTGAGGGAASGGVNPLANNNGGDAGAIKPMIAPEEFAESHTTITNVGGAGAANAAGGGGGAGGVGTWPSSVALQAAFLRLTSNAVAAAGQVGGTVRTQVYDGSRSGIPGEPTTLPNGGAGGNGQSPGLNGAPGEAPTGWGVGGGGGGGGGGAAAASVGGNGGAGGNGGPGLIIIDFDTST